MASYKPKEKFKITFVMLIVSLLGFLVALSWNDAIISALDALLPKEKILVYKFISAVIMTTILVLVIFLINKSLKKKE